MRTRVRDLLVLMVSAKPKVRVEDRGREPNLREREWRAGVLVRQKAVTYCAKASNDFSSLFELHQPNSVIVRVKTRSLLM